MSKGFQFGEHLNVVFRDESVESPPELPFEIGKWVGPSRGFIV